MLESGKMTNKNFNIVTDLKEIHINKVLRVQNFLIDLEKLIG